MTPELPAGAWPGLHILPPWLDWLPRLLLLSLLAVLLWRWWRARAGRPKRAAPPPAPAGPGLADRIAALIDHWDVAGDYRAGFHALAALVRRQLEAATGLPVEEMTVEEAERTIASEDVVRLLVHLRDRQFAPRPPLRREFMDACAEARLVLDRRRPIRVRRPGRPG